MAKNNNLQDFVTDIADAIREKKGTEDKINPQDFADEIRDIHEEVDMFGLSTIGFTKVKDAWIKENIIYAQQLAEQWDPNGTTPLLFQNNQKLLFLPALKFNAPINTTYMFENCYGLVAIANESIPITGNCDYMFEKCHSLHKAPIFENPITSANAMFSECYSLQGEICLVLSKDIKTVGSMFANCKSLQKVKLINTENCTYWFAAFSNCLSLQRIEGIDLSSATRLDMGHNYNYNLQYIEIKNLGKSSATNFPFGSGCFPVWGVGSEENRQSLVDSLLTYSYDRAANGLPTATIQLSSTTKALLTEEEIAQITAKGFTIA